MNQPDQTDIIAANERLTTELAAATRERDEARGQLTAAQSQVTQLTIERDAARTQLTEATRAVGDVTQQLAAVRTERDALAAKDHDFNKRLAAELVKHGIRAEGVETGGAAAVATRKLTLTEECRAARGI